MCLSSLRFGRLAASLALTAMALTAMALPAWAQAQQSAPKKPEARVQPQPQPPDVTRKVPAPAANDEEDDDDAPSESAANPRDGTIVRIDHDVVFFDVGSDRGVVVGQTIAVLRTIRAKHPVTGQRLIDHFPLGTLHVDGVGTVLSFGRPEHRIAPLVKVGDVVSILLPAKPEPVRAARPMPAKETAAESQRPDRAAPGKAMPTGTAAPLDNSAEAEARRAFQATLGRPLAERIKTLETFLATHRDNPFRTALEQELTQLRTVHTTIERAFDQLAHKKDEGTAQSSGSSGAGPRKMSPVASVAIPERIHDGDPLEVVVYVANPQIVQSGWVFYRRQSDRTYSRVALTPDGDGYYRALIPKKHVVAGVIELYAALVDNTSQMFLFGGFAHDPTTVVIDPHPSPPQPPGPGHSAVSGFFEFVDFNRFRNNDYFFKAEADFMYRIGGILYSVRTGFGLLSGLGESVHNLDDLNMAPRQVGINYGYVEGELRFHRLVGMAARVLGGQTKSGGGGGGGGAELKLRIGSELGTNLVIGGAIISDFGALAQLQLEWNVLKNWPMSVTVVATNQPVQTDLGVRLIYQVGWRVQKWIAPTLRIGYDFRNINHGGLSLGLGLVMSW